MRQVCTCTDTHYTPRLLDTVTDEDSVIHSSVMTLQRLKLEVIGILVPTTAVSRGGRAKATGVCIVKGAS